MTETTQILYNEYTAPEYGLDGYHCPHSACGVFSKQNWFLCATLFSNNQYSGSSKREKRIQFVICERCGEISMWHDGKMVYPSTSTAPAPHKDIPSEVLTEYNEARDIYPFSPRASAALLRLVTEKLTLLLVNKSNRDPGPTLNVNIGILVEEGLPIAIQKAMDSLRVIGNDAVHPGFIDFNDSKDIAFKLFKLLNIIVENRITQVNEIEKLYEGKVPDTKKEQIEDRDSTS